MMVRKGVNGDENQQKIAGVKSKKYSLDTIRSTLAAKKQKQIEHHQQRDDDDDDDEEEEEEEQEEMEEDEEMIDEVELDPEDVVEQEEIDEDYIENKKLKSYMEINQILANENEKHKQLIQIKECEILELKRDLFELKEYLIQIEHENDQLKEALTKQNKINDSCEFKEMSCLIDQITKLSAVFPSLHDKIQLLNKLSGSCKRESFDSSITTANSVRTSRSSVTNILSASNIESMNKMRQLAESNCKKLEKNVINNCEEINRKQVDDEEKHIIDQEIEEETEELIEESENFDHSDIYNEQIDKRNQIKMNMEALSDVGNETDNGMLDVIAEEDDESEEESENMEEEMEQQQNAEQKQENDDRVEQQQQQEEEKFEDNQSLVTSMNEPEEDDWLKKKPVAIQKYEKNSLSKHKSIKRVSFDNNSNSNDESELKQQAIQRKSNIRRESNTFENGEDDVNRHKKSAKMSLDRRRSQVFVPIDQSPTVYEEQDSIPQLQPIYFEHSPNSTYTIATTSAGESKTPAIQKGGILKKPNSKPSNSDDTLSDEKAQINVNQKGKIIKQTSKESPKSVAEQPVQDNRKNDLKEVGNQQLSDDSGVVEVKNPKPVSRNQKPKPAKMLQQIDVPVVTEQQEEISTKVLTNDQQMNKNENVKISESKQDDSNKSNVQPQTVVEEKPATIVKKIIKKKTEPTENTNNAESNDTNDEKEKEINTVGAASQENRRQSIKIKSSKQVKQNDKSPITDTMDDIFNSVISNSQENEDELKISNMKSGENASSNEEKTTNTASNNHVFFKTKQKQPKTVQFKQNTEEKEDATIDQNEQDKKVFDLEEPERVIKQKKVTQKKQALESSEKQEPKVKETKETQQQKDSPVTTISDPSNSELKENIVRIEQQPTLNIKQKIINRIFKSKSTKQNQNKQQEQVFDIIKEKTSNELDSEIQKDSSNKNIAENIDNDQQQEQPPKSSLITKKAEKSKATKLNQNDNKNALQQQKQKQEFVDDSITPESIENDQEKKENNDLQQLQQQLPKAVVTNKKMEKQKSETNLRAKVTKVSQNENDILQQQIFLDTKNTDISEMAEIELEKKENNENSEQSQKSFDENKSQPSNKRTVKELYADENSNSSHSDQQNQSIKTNNTSSQDEPFTSIENVSRDTDEQEEGARTKRIKKLVSYKEPVLNSYVFTLECM